MKDKSILISTIIFTICVLIIIICIILLNLNRITNFENACESFGGEYYILENASCSLGHENCIYMCKINGEYYSLDDVGTHNINKFFCIKVGERK